MTNGTGFSRLSRGLPSSMLLEGGEIHSDAWDGGSEGMVENKCAMSITRKGSIVVKKLIIKTL